MKKIFSGEEINKSRQIEFDLAKGFFVFNIIFIHAFQVAGRGNGTKHPAYMLIYMATVLSGAAIFIFALGLGTVYKRTETPGGLVKRGIRLIIYQYLNNLAYVVSAVIPFLWLSLFGDSSELKEEVLFHVRLFLPYINIFFLAGAIYLILAFLRRIKLPNYGYLILGLAINIFTPSLVGIRTESAFLNLLLAPLFGGAPYVSFCVSTYLPYALLGVWFASILKKVVDKDNFYRLLLIMSGIILFIWFYIVSNKVEGLNEAFAYFAKGYIYPDFFRTIVNLAGVFITLGIFHFSRNIIAGIPSLDKQLKYQSEHISKYYAIHPTLFFLIYGFNGYQSLGLKGGILAFFVGLLYTDLLVKLYNKKKLITGRKEDEYRKEN